MLKTVLQFYLRVRREAICRRDVDSFEIWTPMLVTAEAITDCVKELLVPAKRAKKLRRKFVFGFDVISERVRISHIRDFKTRFIKLSPQLQVMPREADVLSKNKFSIVADVAPRR